MTTDHELFVPSAASAGAVPVAESASGAGTFALRLRRYVTVTCLPAIFVLMAVGTAIDPLDDSAPAAATVAQAAGHAGAVVALAWLELTGAVVTIAGLLGLVGAIRGRGAGWANVTGVLALLSGIGMAALSLNHIVVAGLAGSGLAAPQQAAVIDAFHTVGGPVVVLFMLGPVVYLAASIAAWRAGLLPRAGVILGILFAVTATFSTPIAEYTAFAVGFALTAWIARGLLRAR